MLTLKCSACRQKLWRYDKIGQGEVLRCHKARILKDYGNSRINEDKVMCACGGVVAIDKGTYYKMLARAFTASGSKRNSAEKNKRGRRDAIRREP